MALGQMKDEAKRIEDFLQIPLPENWDDWSLKQRREFWLAGGIGGVRPRQKVCAMEIWQELFGFDRATYTQKVAREINNIIKRDAHRHQSTSVDCGLPYGRQRGFIFGESITPRAEIKPRIDDYFVVVYRLLSYLYNCFVIGDEPDLDCVSANVLEINTGYWENIISCLLREDFIACTAQNGAQVYSITHKGIEFLHTHSLIKKAAKIFKVAANSCTV